MAFSEITGKTVSIIKEEYIGRPLPVCYYLRSYTERNEQFKNEQQIHMFQKKEGGEMISIYGFGHMDYLVKLLTPGALCRITYQGKEHVDKIKKDVHRVKIEQDISDTITVPAHTAPVAVSPEAPAVTPSASAPMPQVTPKPSPAPAPAPDQDEAPLPF